MKKVTASKKEVGIRFREFRKAIDKSQKEIADEVRVSQSTFANIEGGKAYPNLSYLLHFSQKYHLDIIWVLTGDGQMLKEKDNPPDKYSDLINYLRVPIISQMLLAKLAETKVVLKDNIKNYFEKREKKEAS
ncbi:MAG: Helix-turn-helix protein [Acidobacteriota bacterium]|nr:Helix-turn-helix protein [Acidobacteriota bacterium]